MPLLNTMDPLGHHCVTPLSGAIPALFSVPLQGVLSDSYGRRPIILVALLGSLVRSPTLTRTRILHVPLPLVLQVMMLPHLLLTLWKFDIRFLWITQFIYGIPCPLDTFRHSVRAAVSRSYLLLVVQCSSAQELCSLPL